MNGAKLLKEIRKILSEDEEPNLGNMFRISLTAAEDTIENQHELAELVNGVKDVLLDLKTVVEKSEKETKQYRTDHDESHTVHKALHEEMVKEYMSNPVVSLGSFIKRKPKLSAGILSGLLVVSQLIPFRALLFQLLVTYDLIPKEWLEFLIR